MEKAGRGAVIEQKLTEKHFSQSVDIDGIGRYDTARGSPLGVACVAGAAAATFAADNANFLEANQA